MSASSPRHGDYGICAKCRGDIEYVVYAAYNGDTLDAWWAHAVHPADNHDAQVAA